MRDVRLIKSQESYVLAPKRVINPSGVDGQEAEGNATQVVREPAMVKIFRMTTESVIAGRHGHANL